MQNTKTKFNWSRLFSYLSGAASIISICFIYKSARLFNNELGRLSKFLQFNDEQAFHQIIAQGNYDREFLIKSLEGTVTRETFSNHCFKNLALGVKIKNVTDFQIRAIGGKNFEGKALNKSKFYKIKCKCSLQSFISNGYLNKLIQGPSILTEYKTIMCVYGRAKFIKQQNIIQMKVQKIGTDYDNLRSMWLNVLDEILIKILLISCIMGIFTSLTINLGFESILTKSMKIC